MHARLARLLPIVAVAFFAVAPGTSAQQTSANNAKLKDALARFPDADADKDGVLTTEEAQAYLAKRRGSDSAAKGQNTTVFRPTLEELGAAIAAGRESNGNQPLEFEKGNGLRIVMTGHSWVAPAVKTLPGIAEAAGLDGHHQRTHTSGGGTGAANAIWLKEFGKYDDGKGLRAVLLPAIATGEWDVMTWGSYYDDKPGYYGQWIDVCLAHNPEMVFYIQDGWPRFLPEYGNLQPADVLAKIEANQAELQGGMYRTLFQSLNETYPGKIHIIPASPIVVELVRGFYEGELPDLDCVDEDRSLDRNGIYRDGGHLSRTSGTEHLVGYAYFGTLYKKSPALLEGYAPGGVPPKLDKRMREAAWRAITASPFTGIKDANANGIADDHE